MTNRIDEDIQVENQDGEISPEEATGETTTPTDTAVGKVAAPPKQEATSKEFYFWAKRHQTVESGQLVYTDTNFGGLNFRTYGITSEVYRQSRKRDMSEEFDQYDGDTNYTPPFNPDGITFASVSTLRTIPPLQSPPIEGNPVFLGGEDEFQIAYNLDDTDDEKRLVLGLIKNGGNGYAGQGFIDTDYFLGANAGHLNVNGMAGQGTKSSFLLHVVYMMLRKAFQLQTDYPSADNNPIIVPIIFNVKNYDLFYIDQPNRYLTEERRSKWELLGVTNPTPFTNATFYAPQEASSTNPVRTGRDELVTAYSWGLADVIQQGLLQYLFAEDDRDNSNFTSLVLDIQENLTDTDLQGNTILNPSSPVRTFEDLLQVARDNNMRVSWLGGHLSPTWQMLSRRLNKILLESRGVIRRADETASPLDVVRFANTYPQVIDLASLAETPEMQRFVVAAVFRQLINARAGSDARLPVRYLVVLDELNRFAPRNGSDPITRLFRTVALEGRSQGIILLGAQQQASKVLTEVVENAGIRVAGRSGATELTTDVWRSFSDSARRKIINLLNIEKLVLQSTFREPLHLEIPFPAWAMNPREIGIPLTNPATNNSTDSNDLTDEFAP
jgi:uncharacterized protein